VDNVITKVNNRSSKTALCSATVAASLLYTIVDHFMELLEQAAPTPP